MANIIQLFEKMGQDAALQNPEARQAVIEAAELDAGIARALLEGDVSSLERQLDIAPDIFCSQVPAEELPEEESPNEEEPEMSRMVVNG